MLINNTQPSANHIYVLVQATNPLANTLRSARLCSASEADAAMPTQAAPPPAQPLCLHHTRHPNGTRPQVVEQLSYARRRTSSLSTNRTLSKGTGKKVSSAVCAGKSCVVIAMAHQQSGARAWPSTGRRFLKHGSSEQSLTCHKANALHLAQY